MPKGGFYGSKYQFCTYFIFSYFYDIEFISHLVSCFPAIGGVIFSHKGLGNGQWIVWYGTRNMYISMKYEGKTKILTKMTSKLLTKMTSKSCLLRFFSAKSDSFGIFPKIPNFKTFQIECLWNFQLAIFKATKQSCCHGNRISRKN